MKTNAPYSTSEATAAKASWEPVYSSPASETVKPGSTRQIAASATTVDRAAPLPEALKEANPCRSAPMSSESPTMPLSEIISAAKTVSRAYVAAPSPPPRVSITISPTSITVTATARTRDPNGSPIRCATTSAWWTAASTAPTSTTATSASSSGCSVFGQVTASRTRPRRGRATVHWSGPRRAGAVMPSP